MKTARGRKGALIPPGQIVFRGLQQDDICGGKFLWMYGGYHSPRKRKNPGVVENLNPGPRQRVDFENGDARPGVFIPSNKQSWCWQSGKMLTTLGDYNQCWRTASVNPGGMLPKLEKTFAGLTVSSPLSFFPNHLLHLPKILQVNSGGVGPPVPHAESDGFDIPVPII